MLEYWQIMHSPGKQGQALTGSPRTVNQQLLSRMLEQEVQRFVSELRSKAKIQSSAISVDPSASKDFRLRPCLPLSTSSQRASHALLRSHFFY
jgi:hypothetical protein